MLVAISSRQQVQAEVAVPEMRKERHLEGGLGPDARVDEQEPRCTKSAWGVRR